MASTPVSPTPVQNAAPGSSTAAQRKGRGPDAEGHGATSAAGFSQALQAVGLPEAGGAVAQGLAALVAAAQPEDTEVLSAEMLAQQAAWAADPAWSVHSLVGQTAQLDQAADAAVRDGSHLQARLDAGPSTRWGAASMAAAAANGQAPVVAQGVAVDAGDVASTASLPRDGGAAAGHALGDPALAEAVVPDVGEPADAPQRGERSSEGRMALQGQWVAVDRQAPPAESMQRVLGQMTQFLAANGGGAAGELRRAAGKKSEADTAVSGSESGFVHAGSGSGRLTENAVAQAAASQQAQNSEPQAEPEMSFWMNSRQQRAEMVLDRDGEPVRVQVTLQGNEAHVTFLSDAQGTRSMLDASLAQLRDMLAAQGVELAGVQVRTQADGSGAQGEASGRQEDFMPEGARRMRMGTTEMAGVGQGVADVARGAVARGLDVFA